MGACTVECEAGLDIGRQTQEQILKPTVSASAIPVKTPFRKNRHGLYHHAQVPSSEIKPFPGSQPLQCQEFSS